MRSRSLLMCGICAAAIMGVVIIHSCKDDDGPTNPTTSAAVTLKLITDNLVSPIDVVSVPDDSKRLFVIDQIGKIWIIDANGNKLPTPFLDLTSKMVTLNGGYDERGLLGLAFHPDYKTNGRFFVYYQMPPRAGGPTPSSNWDNLSRLAEFKVSSDANVADPSSEKVLMDWDDPQSNHNGGTLAFGPDGYLYMSVGDGGGADDKDPGHVTDWYHGNAGGNGQDIDSNLLGNILRLDVNSGSPYGIPGDNPFVGKDGKDEIYAFGFRNPYRFSFDMGGNHDLIAGDAGQSLYEEIDLVTKGGNYGWNVKEGTHCFNAASDKTEGSGCPAIDSATGQPLIDPVIEMNNASNPKGGTVTAIIGGNVYRGKAIPSLQGVYIFGNFSQPGNTANGEIFQAKPAGNTMWTASKLTMKAFPNGLGHGVKGFGQDADGEVYVTTSDQMGPMGNTGKVYKIVPDSTANN